MLTTLQKWGNSQAVRLPKAILQSAKMQDNERVRITATRDKIVITRETPTAHKTLKERIAGFRDDYQFEEWETGTPIGREVW